MKRIIVFISFIAFAFCAFATSSACYKCIDKDCSNVPPVEPIPPDWASGDWPDGGDVVVTETDGSEAAASSPCGRSCANWKKLGCPEAEPTRGGMSCYRQCVHRASLVRIPSKCWSEAKTVSALRSCGGIRCQ